MEGLQPDPGKIISITEHRQTSDLRPEINPDIPDKIVRGVGQLLELFLSSTNSPLNQLPNTNSETDVRNDA